MTGHLKALNAAIEAVQNRRQLELPIGEKTSVMSASIFSLSFVVGKSRSIRFSDFCVIQFSWVMPLQ